MSDLSFFIVATIGLILYMLLVSQTEARLKNLEDRDNKKDN